ncbi:MAG TPA: CHAT domain-containing protein [Marmoricola sp.]|nr:CHAT domain-containing protein [Marmoricola sp.]
MSGPGGATPEVGEELLPLALSRPQEALARAGDLLAASSDPGLLSFARQAIGIVLRDRGDLADAVAELRTALRLARAARRPDRAADVRATLGAALVMDGLTSRGLAELDAAADSSEGVLLSRVLTRKAYVLSMLGRHAEALDDIRRALPGIRRSGDLVWEARTLNNRADLHLALGAVSRAEHDVVAAQALFRQAGQELEEVLTVHNRGLVAFRKGDMPAALALLDEAARRYEALGVDEPELAIDRCVAYLAAGLTAEAVEVVGTALAEHPGQPTQRAKLELMAAQAALADGDAVRALEHARSAGRSFRRQQRPWWELQAGLASVRARSALGSCSVDIAVSVANRLAEEGSDQAPLALTVAGRLAAEQELASSRGLFARAARGRRRGPALNRATGWLARALGCAAEGDERGALLACAHGLEALDEHQASLGSTELRALATSHGRELAEIALRMASRRDGRTLLRWSERWRATALTLPPVRAPEDTPLAGDLASLRETVRRIELNRQSGLSTVGLERHRARLERTIRTQRLHTSGDRRAAQKLDLGRLLDTLGHTTLVELVAVDGTLLAVVASRGRVRRYVVGPVAEASQAVELARFTLRRAARGRPGDLASVGARLESALLGPVARQLPDGPVVVSPPGPLQAAPWGLLPALARRPVSQSPSAAMWLRTAARISSDGGGEVLIGGPGLPAGGRELVELARRRPGAVVLGEGSATVDRALAAMDGASLVHVVAHGQFRRDNPMFSSLLLDDGPLTVHDLERLESAPRRLVLSACDSGVMAPVGADELIGLSSALLSLGTAGVVSSVAEVNDEATCTFMGELHGELLRSGTVADAVLAARTAAGRDPVSVATAASFVAFGT